MKVYPLTPNKITETSVSYSTRKVEFEESSYVQKIATRRTPKISFRLEHYMLNAENEKRIVDFFKTAKGSLLSFQFYNYIDGETYQCSFKNDVLSVDRVNAMFCNISVELETC